MEYFPNVDTGRWIWALPKSTEQALRELEQTLDRARGAAHFCYLCAKGIQNEQVGILKVLKEKKAYLRASLAELVSMEDTLKREYKIAGITTPSVRLNTTPNPLLHILRELRNLEIHLNSSTLSRESVAVQGRSFSQPLDIDIFCIDNLRPDSFRKLRNAKTYYPEQLEEAVTLFLAAQSRWGITELVIRGVEAYCAEIIAQYTGLNN